VVTVAGVSAVARCVVVLASCVSKITQCVGHWREFKSSLKSSVS
jgi:hypothetical protein